MVGVKEIVSVTMTCILGVYMLYFIVPEMKTVYNGVTSIANKTAPSMSNVLIVTDSWMNILPLFVLFILGLTIWLYISRRGADDY